MLADADFDELVGQRVGLIGNQTSIANGEHLIDLLAARPGIELVAAFAPEHGIRGIADAGQAINDEIDQETGTPVISLYGATRAPLPSTLEGIDVLLFDLQDVGTRYYTYISTMGLAMQAAAAAGVPFIVLDRPNPHGGVLMEGAMRDASQESFISQYPIPAVYGLTAGELALAIRGEGWLTGLENLDLRVIPMEGWKRSQTWPDTERTWIGPSPGLPTVESALVYPGSVFFEATTLSYGNGTEFPFSTVGASWLDGDRFVADVRSSTTAAGLTGFDLASVAYTPVVIPDVAPSPRHEGQLMRGARVSVTDPGAYQPTIVGLHLLVAAQAQATELGLGSIIDRGAVFDLLAGTSSLRRDLTNGTDITEIQAGWQADLTAFRASTAPYLLYD